MDDDYEQVGRLGQIRNLISSYGLWRIALAVFALITLSYTGISYFSMPANEVIYSHHALTVPMESGVAILYIMEFGNTGRNALDDVKITLNEELVNKAMLPPRFANHGIGDRNAEGIRSNGAITYSMGRMKPGLRIKSTVSIMYKDVADVAQWEDLLVKIEPSEGDVKRGDPASTLFVRIIYRFLGAF